MSKFEIAQTGVSEIKTRAAVALRKDGERILAKYAQKFYLEQF